MINIFEADINCLERIFEIEKTSFSKPWSYDSMIEAFESDTVSIYAAENEFNEKTAFIMALQIDYEAEILNIAVSPEHRHQGIASALMHHILAEFEKRSVESIYLEVRESNIPAIGLYIKSGFKQFGTRRNYYSDPKENAILMKKTRMTRNND